VRLLVIGLLMLITAGLLAAAVLDGYREDQQVIRMFAGTGVAGKIDTIGSAPGYLLVEDESSRFLERVTVAADGTFVARLEPGVYRLQVPQDRRSAVVTVPRGECLDLVLDFRLPMVVLEIPGEGWPVPSQIE
jgi:hypothetical protein